MHLGPVLPLMRRYSQSGYGGVVLTAVGLVPSAPLLVPELAGATTAESDGIRAAVLTAGQLLAADSDHWTILCAGDSATSVALSGTFRGFGADVAVSLVPADGDEPDVLMPLPVLIGAWLRTQLAPGIEADARLVAPDTDCRVVGTELFNELESSDRRESLLVVADGSTMLTARAPGAFHSDAPAFQQKLDTAIERGDWDTVVVLDPNDFERFGAGPGRAPLQVMAAVLSEMKANRSEGEYCAPLGVGYHVRTWLR